MSFASEFKQFAMKGNVVDLAVGVIIGAAFGKIVDSIVGDLVLPVVSRVLGGLDFSNYFFPLAGQAANIPLAEAKKAGAVLAYGNFVTVLGELPDPGLHHLHHGQADQPPEERGTAGTARRHAGRRDAAARNPRFAQEIAFAAVLPVRAAAVQRRAMRMAAIRLAGSARPAPAMSNAVP